VNVCVLGRGKVGRALHAGLRAAGVASTLRAGRAPRLPRSPCDAYVLAVPDGRIAALADALAPALPRRAVVLHCAGARGVDELAPVAARGLAVGVMHPLVSFAGARTTQLAGVTFTLLGDTRALRTARRIARALGAHAVTLREPGPAYHAAAALVANGAVALADAGARVLAQLGYPPAAAGRALGGLLASVAHNVAALGPGAALTGPVVRGDVATVAAHLHALTALDPALAHAYARVLPLIAATAGSRLGAARARFDALSRRAEAASPVSARGTRRRRAAR